jgi:hypothetical protein
MNIKKLIAREGLIIIVILSLLGTFFFISSKINQRRENIEDIKLYTIKTEDGKIFKIPAKDETILESRVNEVDKGGFLDNVKQEKGQEYINKTYHSEIKSVEERTKLSRITAVMDNYIIILLIAAYPGYLVLRFVLWAIKTLRS